MLLKNACICIRCSSCSGTPTSTGVHNSFNSWSCLLSQHIQANNGVRLRLKSSSMHAFIHSYILRKRAGFNVGRFDIEIGKAEAAPSSHDFLDPAGFLLGTQLMHANKFCMHAIYIYIVSLNL